MAGCAMIGQSVINVKSGGRTRLSGIAAALFLLAFILFASGLIEQIPLAALVGVMFMVVIGTFAWQSFSIMRKVPKLDAFVILLVTGVTVLHDLAVAVVVGVIVSALAYAWSNAKRITAQIETTDDTKVYRIQGPLFFGSVDGFSELFSVSDDPENVVVDFNDSRIADQSALQAIDALAVKYEAAGKKLIAQYDKYEIFPGKNVKGEFTLGENIGDLAGLTVAYDAYKASLGGKESPVIDGMTGDQRFFLGWAQVWRRKYRDAELSRRLLTDSHSPSAQRTWVVRNLDKWYDAFKPKENEKLYLAPEDRVRIW